MAEDVEGKHGGRSRFLSKSKWGKVFKENDTPPPPGKVNSFKLNDDVVDFLKPSTEKSKPKIDVAIASRWPSANEVRRASETSTPAQSGVPQWTGYRKPRRREGLRVGFVRAAPEIIGEGGDEAPDPVAEVGRRRAAMPRSVSDPRPGALDDGSPWPGTQDTRQLPRQARAPSIPKDDFKPPPVWRMNTSHNEFSPPVQRKVVSRPIPPDEPFNRPTLDRTPTGFNSQEQGLNFRPTHDYEERPMPKLQIPKQNDVPQMSTDNLTPGGFRKRQLEMEANEGMTLRRPSALHMNDESGQISPQAGAGFQPPPDFSSRLSNAETSDVVAEMTASPETGLSPDSVMSPQGQNLFADPKYVKRHSGELASAARVQQRPVAQSVGEHATVAKVRQRPAAQSMSQPRSTEPPSYMRNHRHAQSQPAVLPPSQHAPTFAARRPIEQPSYMRGCVRPAPAQQEPVAHRHSPNAVGNTNRYMPEAQSSITQAMLMRPPPAPSQTVNAEHDGRMRDQSPMRDRISAAQDGPETARGFYHQPNYSGGINHFPASPQLGNHSRNSSREDLAPVRKPVPIGNAATRGLRTGSTSCENVSQQTRLPSNSSSQQWPQDRFQTDRGGPQHHDPQSALLSPAPPTNAIASPYSRGPSPADYFSAPQTAQPGKSPAAQLQQEQTARPDSAASGRLAYRALPSPLPPSQGDPAADRALADFAGRVAHMKGVFRLTAEKERPAEQCTPQAWLRAGLWWYLEGKAGLEMLLQQRPRGPEGYQELLTQPHVDLAKAWWILSDHLEQFEMVDSPQSARSPDAHLLLLQSVAVLRSHLKALCASMAKYQLMPPSQSLIQGQNTAIWLDYPQYTTDAIAVLNGSAGKYLIVETPASALAPLDALPLGETKEAFCFGRFTVEASISTDEADTDRVPMACKLSMRRSKREFQPSIAIASQTDLVNIQLGPRRGEEKGLSWYDVSWKASSCGVSIHLPRGFDLSLRMSERDFRSLWNLVESSRKVEQSLRPLSNEVIVHEARLAEVQYADSAGGYAFPAEKLRNCTALIFERTDEHRDGNGVRKMHRGYRLQLFTEPVHTPLSTVSHGVSSQSPLFFEFITDAAAHGTTAMIVRIREQSKQCRILLVFPDMASRQAFYDVLNGLTVGPEETIVGKMALTGVNIQAAMQVEGFSPVSHPALQGLQWQKLGVTNNHSDDPSTRIPRTIESESLRIVARHAAGCITDRLNLGKGDLMLRLPPVNEPIPSVQLLRDPQEDLTMSIDTRQSHPKTADGIAELYQLAKQQQTVRTFSFATLGDLHAFQAAITGYIVRYDGIASNFGISHRMNYVPVYKNQKASGARLQIVSAGSITQVLAFMEDFTLAEALCFQVKSTDTFESVKGDGKGKKWAVKMVDAKFSLPRHEKGEMEPAERMRRRFVNLEGLEYAEEHDDITIGFDTNEERDRFAQALPAAATVGQGLTLRRRI